METDSPLLDSQLSSVLHDIIRHHADFRDMVSLLNERLDVLSLPVLMGPMRGDWWFVRGKDGKTIAKGTFSIAFKALLDEILPT